MGKAAEGVGGVGMGPGQEVAPGAVSCDQGVGRLSSEVEGRRGDFLCSDVHFT